MYLIYSNEKAGLDLGVQKNSNQLPYKVTMEMDIQMSCDIREIISETLTVKSIIKGRHVPPPFL
jgi:hypothetical protein